MEVYPSAVPPLNETETINGCVASFLLHTSAFWFHPNINRVVLNGNKKIRRINNSQK